MPTTAMTIIKIRTTHTTTQTHTHSRARTHVFAGIYLYAHICTFVRWVKRMWGLAHRINAGLGLREIHRRTQSTARMELMKVEVYAETIIVCKRP